MDKVFRKGDTVKVTDLSEITKGRTFFDEGDITVVADVGFFGVLPYILVKPKRNLDDAVLNGTGLFPILLPEFGGLTLVSTSLELQFEDAQRAKQHGLQVGDKVSVNDVDNILFGHLHFKNGDVVEVVDIMFGHPILSTPNQKGLIISEHELNFIQKVGN